MKKVRKVAVVMLMVFGAVSVSFGVDLYSNEEPYQKLKAEMEMYDLVDFEKRCNKKDLDHIKNVIAFFDEIKAMKVEKNSFQKAVEKVREMPRFKNDSGIYSYAKGAYFKEEVFWKSVWYEWEMTKLELESCGAKKGYWEAVKKESE